MDALLSLWPLLLLAGVFVVAWRFIGRCYQDEDREGK